MLHQNQFSYAHFPELVDLTVVGTGLGLLQSKISFVNEKGTFWDSTQWDVAPRPFLDIQPLAYATAIAAWTRSDKDPNWTNELPPGVKGPLKKSLKFLHKTNDSFFQPALAPTAGRPHILKQSQEKWWQLAASKSTSTHVIAVRHLQPENSLTEAQQSMLIDNLRSSNRAILLHTIDATDEMKDVDDSIVEELRLLVDHRDDEVRAKALCTLTKLGQLDEDTVRLAARMLDSKARHVVFSAIMALASEASVTDPTLPAVDRGFLRALQSCDYEFVGLFVAAYQKWLDDPTPHFEMLLQDSPEYLEVTSEALQNIREQLVALG